MVIREEIKRILVFICIAFLIIVVPLQILRLYQSANVSKILKSYFNAEKTKIEFDTFRSDTTTIIRPNGMFNLFDLPSEGNGLGFELLAIKINYKLIKNKSNSLIKVYYYNENNLNSFQDWSHNIKFSCNNSENFLFLPVYLYGNQNNFQYFREFIFPNSNGDIIEEIFKINNPDMLQIIMTLNGCIRQNYLQLMEFTKIKTNDFSNINKNPFFSSFSFKNKNIFFSNKNILIDGVMKNSSCGLNRDDNHASKTVNCSISNSIGELQPGLVNSDLIISEKLDLKGGDKISLSGELLVGGITFAVFQKDIAIGYNHITKRGNFSNNITIPSDGLYEIGIANYLDKNTSLENRLIINHFNY